ncbi:MAG: ribosomal protein S18-alanine N-acetyltransferase [Solirubrobacterales bacterium]
MIEILIRMMTENDLDQILAIENVSFPTPWSRNSFLNELKNPLAIYLVVDLDGEVGGYAGVWIVFEEAHVTNVAVRSDLRGNQLGELMLSKLEEVAMANQCERIMLEVRPSNHAARSLYTRMGFAQEGVRKKYYLDNDEDALIMSKKLIERE